jgi:hypothetical protein
MRTCIKAIKNRQQAGWSSVALLVFRLSAALAKKINTTPAFYGALYF